MQRQKTRGTQKQLTRTKLTPQQMLNVQVTEMPINQLEDFIKKQSIENLALESTPSEHSLGDETSATEPERPSYDSMTLPEDSIPVSYNNTNTTERVYGNIESFYDKLKEQIGEYDLSEKQRNIIEYLIGSLDGDGLLRKSTESLVDEMEIYENIDTSTEEVAYVLKILQSFDPPGVGAQSLQQCLLIQIDRKKHEPMQQLMRTVVEKYYDDFQKKHWNKLQKVLNLDDAKKDKLLSELKKLNPKPGSSLGEVEGFSIDRIIPDFIIETYDDGQVSFSLNDGHLPQLTIAPSFTKTLNEYKNDTAALAFTKKSIDNARGLIDALKTRRHTMMLTMKAIIQWQHKFFQDGDENDLRPMRLKDIADRTGLDISTISRVTNEKYAQTRWGIYRLRFFFTDKYTNEKGEELSTRKMKLALKEIIDQEDKKNPLSDQALEKEMRRREFDVARRTIAKYRDQMGIPKASLRKE